MVKALYVYLVRHAESKNNSRDMHDVHSSANLPSSPLGSPKEPRILSTLREGYEEKKDGEDELKQAELSISSDALLPSPRPGREPDPGLTGRGKEQAKAVAELLQKIKEDPKTESRQALATLTLESATGSPMAEHANGCDTGAEAMAALADKDATELRGMADRLTKGHESLTEAWLRGLLFAVEEMLKDLEIERDLLQKEKGQLNETISLFMKELQKLHIGSQNTVEPMLEEGPLDFVGRFWETVKPRDTAYVAGEHIGEIRKPGEKPEGPNPLAALKQAALAHGVPHELPNVNVQEKVQEVQDMGKQAVKKLSTAFEEARSSAFWQRAQGYWEEKRSEIAKKVDEASTAQRVPAGKTRKKEPTVVAVEKSDAAPSESTTSATTQASEASQDKSTGRGAEKPKPVEKTEVPEAKVEKAPEKEEKTDFCLNFVVPCGARFPAVFLFKHKKALSTLRCSAKETKEKSPTSRQETILIEAQVKIGDGSVQTLCVRASDRCKDAAERFISENSLKALEKV
eukprot:g3997.t1